VRERQVIEGLVSERQRLGAGAHKRNVPVARGRGGEHVGTAVEPDDLAFVAFADGARDETGPRRDIENDVAGLSAQCVDKTGAPARVLTKGQQRSGSLVRGSNPGE